MRVLIVEDNDSVSGTVSLALKKNGIISDIANLGQDCLDVVSLYDYDLMILDLVLPDVSGLEILKKVRNMKRDIPVLILSGLDGHKDKVEGLISGADDYLTKPFNIEELVARVKAIIRRSQGHSKSIITIADMVIDIESHFVSIKGNPLILTNKEQTILEVLALRKGSLITKERLLDHLYNGMDEPDAKIIDVFICKLRKKIIDASGGNNYIETLWGRGYALKDPALIEKEKMVSG